MKITVYELLGMVKDESVGYKYIKYFDRVNEKDDIMLACAEYIIYKLDNSNIELNDIVEILEEPKGIPAKLITWYSVEEHQSLKQNCEFTNCNFEVIYEKINEILDYLESKGESND